VCENKAWGKIDRQDVDIYFLDKRMCCPLQRGPLLSICSDKKAGLYFCPFFWTILSVLRLNRRHGLCHLSLLFYRSIRNNRSWSPAWCFWEDRRTRLWFRSIGLLSQNPAIHGGKLCSFVYCCPLILLAALPWCNWHRAVVEQVVILWTLPRIRIRSLFQYVNSMARLDHLQPK
jgi:hypothetical protein